MGGDQQPVGETREKVGTKRRERRGLSPEAFLWRSQRGPNAKSPIDGIPGHTSPETAMGY